MKENSKSPSIAAIGKAKKETPIKILNWKPE